MTSTKSKLIANYILYTLLIVLCGLPGRALSQAQPKADSAKSSPPAQKTFANPQQAADFLIAAADQFDVPSLLQLFGPGGEDFVATADPVADKRVSVAFAAKADEKKSVQIDPKNPNRAILVVGNEEWPFPIPIVKRNGKWIFDTKAGHREVLARASEPTNSMPLRSAAATWKRSSNTPRKSTTTPWCSSTHRRS